jgi:hypothetical protein
VACNIVTLYRNLWHCWCSLIALSFVWSFYILVVYSTFYPSVNIKKNIKNQNCWWFCCLSCCVLWYGMSVLSIRFLLVGLFQYSSLKYSWITLSYGTCFSNLSFGSLSVICRLHNRWPAFKIHFIYCRLRYTHSLTLAPSAAFHRTWKCHIDGFMIAALWTHLRMFLNQNFTIFMIKCWIMLKPVLGEWTINCIFHYRQWTGTIKPSFQQLHFFFVLCVFLGILYFSLFLHFNWLLWIVSLHVTTNHMIKLNVNNVCSYSATFQSFFFKRQTVYYMNIQEQKLALSVGQCACLFPVFNSKRSGLTL